MAVHFMDSMLGQKLEQIDAEGTMAHRTRRDVRCRVLGAWPNQQDREPSPRSLMIRRNTARGMQGPTGAGPRAHAWRSNRAQTRTTPPLAMIAL